ncbi:hypothetical protein COOONC_02453 [Cooperia oncophora]
MINANYPSFIRFHDWKNCFAYVKNTASHEGTLESLEKVCSGFRSHDWSSSLGYFRVRCCGKPQRYLYVQVFGSLPFTHIFVNRNLATLANFDTNVEVILEPINPTVCTSLEIVPVSEQDYEILVSGK